MDNKSLPDELKFYTTQEVADIMKMNVQVISRKLQKGDLTGYKIGKDWRISEKDLVEWVARHSNQRLIDPRNKIIDSFFKAGKLKSIPSQRKKRTIILEHLLQDFELGRVYDEKEVNEVIRKYHEDVCTIRREFIMEKMMTRKDGKYQRNSSYIRKPFISTAPRPGAADSPPPR